MRLDVSMTVCLPCNNLREFGLPTLGGMSVESARRVTKLMVTAVLGSPTDLRRKSVWRSITAINWALRGSLQLMFASTFEVDGGFHRSRAANQAL